MAASWQGLRPPTMTRLHRLTHFEHRLAGALMALTLAMCAHAEGRGDGLAMPQALQGLPAVGSQCGRSPAEKLQAQQAAAMPSPDARCLLSVSDLARDKALADWTWVDVRRPDLAEAHAMPGALRLSPDMLVGKAFLKGKRLLLLGDGSAQAVLLSQCRRLKSEGFTQVRVLNGGWPQWLFQMAQVSPSEGLASPVTLSAAALWSESQYAGNLVIGQRADGLVSQLPFGATLEAWSVDAVRGLIERRRKELPDTPLASVVLAYAPERSADVPLQALRLALQPTPVLVHVGQAAALRAQLAQMEASWVAHERGPKQPRCGQ